MTHALVVFARAAAPVGWSGVVVVSALAAVIAGSVLVDVRRSRLALPFGALALVLLAAGAAWRFAAYG
jgi:hypothetical protein